MKINGKSLDGHRIVKVYLPVTDGAVEFCFRPLRSEEDFEKVLSKPKPPKSMKPGGVMFSNFEDINYKQAVGSWVQQKLDWEFLVSISVTKGLEWETVDMTKPETWQNWRNDLEKIFSVSEVNQVYVGFMEAQYITEDVMEKARATFLIGQAAQLESLPSLTGGPLDTPSGELVKE